MPGWARWARLPAGRPSVSGCVMLLVIAHPARAFEVHRSAHLPIQPRTTYLRRCARIFDGTQADGTLSGVAAEVEISTADHACAEAGGSHDASYLESGSCVTATFRRGLVDGIRKNQETHRIEHGHSAYELGYAASESTCRARPSLLAMPFIGTEAPRAALGFGDSGGPFRQDELVFASSQPLQSSAVCAAVRREAATKMRQGTRSTFTMIDTNRDVPVHLLPRTLRWLRAALPSMLLPIASRLFPHAAPRPSQLHVYRALVVQYDAAAGLTHQPVHRDASLLSMIISLNSPDEFGGGGTWVEPLSRSFVLGEGQLLLHPSALRHAGARMHQYRRLATSNAGSLVLPSTVSCSAFRTRARVTSGERWVMVIFLSASGLCWHEHGRRFKELAREAAEQGDLQEELRQLHYALAICPRDHELWYDAAASLQDADEPELAARYYRHAIALEPLDAQPQNNIGAVYLQLGLLRQAVGAFRQSLTLDPHNRNAALNAAELLLSLRRVRAATALLSALPASLHDDEDIAELRAVAKQLSGSTE